MNVLAYIGDAIVSAFALFCGVFIGVFIGLVVWGFFH